MRLHLFLLIILVTIVACGSSADPPQATTEPATEIAVAATNTPALQPTDSPVPATAAPTKTARPTFTVIPTNTPVLANTPVVDGEEQSAATSTEESTDSAEEDPTVEPDDTAEPTSEAEATGEGANTPIPTNTSPPITTPQSTETVSPPTNTPQPTNTSPPTNTPLPTNTPTITPIPPTPTPQPTATSAFTPIGDLGSLTDGTEVTVLGNVVATQSFSRGYKFTLSDNSGRVTLLLWDNVYDDCWDCAGLNIGATVIATGEIGRFDGELQVTPWWGGGVQVTAPVGAWASPAAISDLANHVGQRVMIEATVQRMEMNEYGTSIFVNDGTGEAKVFIWSNTWQRVPNQGAVSASGTRIRVVGWVDEFQGRYEIVPVLPYDVVVL